MEHLWIAAAVLAALAQSVRHASLKELNQHLSIAATTYARMLFGLPFLGLYLWGVQSWIGTPLPEPNPRFWAYIAFTALTQVLMTGLMVRLFQLGNFAVGVMLTRADVMLTALIGTALFAEIITRAGWLAIALTFAGVLTASAGRLPRSAWNIGGTSLTSLLFGPTIRIGLAGALVAALSYLALRQAILSLDPKFHPVMRSAYAATIMTLISFVGGALYIAIAEPRAIARIWRWRHIAVVVGLASALGSIGWFTASALANAAYVAAAAQVQVLFVVLISRYWFRESIRPLEIAGIALIVAGVLIFRLA
ncbi:MAG: EamA family transporter [Hyphomicrobiaceae bacterium]